MCCACGNTWTAKERKEIIQIPILFGARLCGGVCVVYNITLNKGSFFCLRRSDMNNTLLGVVTVPSKINYGLLLM